jgi:hypothetical protein
MMFNLGKKMIRGYQKLFADSELQQDLLAAVCGAAPDLGVFAAIRGAWSSADAG